MRMYILERKVAHLGNKFQNNHLHLSFQLNTLQVTIDDPNLLPLNIFYLLILPSAFLL
jgi:hypothetical protein